MFNFAEVEKLKRGASTSSTGAVRTQATRTLDGVYKVFNVAGLVPEWIGNSEVQSTWQIRNLLLDTRSVSGGRDSLFFALVGKLPGALHNGHAYLEKAYEQGVRMFCVQQAPAKPRLEAMPGAVFLLVSDTLLALQTLAKAHRAQFTYPVVGITGSNGKTIVKEWLAQVVERELSVVRSPRSFNSQVGVPLSVWGMESGHELGIFEAGISETGEMALLADIVNPDVAIFTHLGSAHSEGFVSLEEKFKEKWLLCANASQVIYGLEKQPLAQWIEESSPVGQQLFGWQILEVVKSETGGKEIEILFEVVEKGVLERELERSVIGGNFKQERLLYRAKLPFSDQVMVENALHVLVTGLVLGFSIEQMQPELNRLNPVGMRLEWKTGINGMYILDDTWTLDADGLQVAISGLSAFGGATQGRALILSDPADWREAHLTEQLASIATTGRFEVIVGIGTRIEQIDFGVQQFHFHTTEALLAELSDRSSEVLQALEGKLVLVKGARNYRLERVVKLLEISRHGTRLEVSLEALVQNLNYFRKRVPAGTKIMAMVKAGAYGAGSFEVARTLEHHKVDYLAVAYPEEGVRLREHGIKLPIMVLNPELDHDPEDDGAIFLLARNNLEPSLGTLGQLRRWIAVGKEHVLPPCHIELNTGMNRLGFDASDIENLSLLLHNEYENGLRIAGVYSHLVAADNSREDAFTLIQKQRFDQLKNSIEQVWKTSFLAHLANSAAAIRMPELAYDMCRIGIGLYGVDTTREIGVQLSPVSQLLSRVSAVREVAAGETVSYGHTWTLECPAQIATIAIGYADGFSRTWGHGRVRVKINGHLCPTVGAVCMDMMMVDVTGLSIGEGDQVTIFDSQAELEHLAALEETIPYEILTRIGPRVRRVFIG
jgi:Alr-MurF fusion protein